MRPILINDSATPGVAGRSRRRQTLRASSLDGRHRRRCLQSEDLTQTLPRNSYKTLIRVLFIMRVVGTSAMIMLLAVPSRSNTFVMQHSCWRLTATWNVNKTWVERAAWQSRVLLSCIIKTMHYLSINVSYALCPDRISRDAVSFIEDRLRKLMLTFVYIWNFRSHSRCENKAFHVQYEKRRPLLKNTSHWYIMPSPGLLPHRCLDAIINRIAPRFIS